MSTEIKFEPNYNVGYTKDEDLASVIATNILDKLGIFDRITLSQNVVIGEKYFVGKDYDIVSLSFSRDWIAKDPYIVSQGWFFKGNPISLEELMSELDKETVKKLIFNIDALSQKSIDLREFNKNGLNYS